MRKRVSTLILALLAVLGIGLAVPSTASAGNGTSNFYLSGGPCYTDSKQVIGVKFWATNWDNGSGQIYHTAWTRSGVAYSVIGVYIDGVKQGTSSDMKIAYGGHARHTLKITATILGVAQSCSFGL